MDSELMHSIVGSYFNPPERMFVPSFTQNNESSQNHHSANVDINSAKMIQSPNSQALVSALKTLQEKIHRLELERTQAEDNLNILSREAAKYKKALENETNERNLAHQELIKQKKDISIQLSSAQSRCTLLEKQLEYTKRMVLNVEREKNMILDQQAQLQREKEQDQMKLQAKLEKLDILEKECFKLTTTQKTAEDKIKYLEEKLKEEEHHRKLFQDKASELQTGLEINRILMSTVSNPKCCKEKKKSSKKTKCLKREPPQQSYSKFEPLPFGIEGGKMKCAGTDLHSMHVSVQSLLKVMQHHGPPRLQKPANITKSRCLSGPSRTTSPCEPLTPDYGKSVSVCDSLSELLMAMQDELDQMSMEHQELLCQMRETDSHSVCEDIECELEHLVQKMRIKGEQISKLRKHQDSVHKLQQKVQNSVMNAASGVRREGSGPKGSKDFRGSPRKCLPTDPSQKSNSSSSSSSCLPAHTRRLRTRLRKDDIMWEQ